MSWKMGVTHPIVLQMRRGYLSLQSGQKILCCDSMTSFVEKNWNEFIWPAHFVKLQFALNAAEE
jgi:hypothetical protein